MNWWNWHSGDRSSDDAADMGWSYRLSGGRILTDGLYDRFFRKRKQTGKLWQQIACFLSEFLE
ncbi:MAG: hypothetical protein NC305_09620 [Lachnospiraceae bacterium]|nr:hypothetical protein [Lachnospiraceae bacterium]MCM1410789.1 hypothetical protein [Lachnospiraceae bacterium]